MFYIHSHVLIKALAALQRRLLFCGESGFLLCARFICLDRPWSVAMPCRIFPDEPKRWFNLSCSKCSELFVGLSSKCQKVSEVYSTIWCSVMSHSDKPTLCHKSAQRSRRPSTKDFSFCWKRCSRSFLQTCSEVDFTGWCITLIAVNDHRRRNWRRLG